jgi:hypothetical protein
LQLASLEGHAGRRHAALEHPLRPSTLGPSKTKVTLSTATLQGFKPSGVLVREHALGRLGCADATGNLARYAKTSAD